MYQSQLLDISVQILRSVLIFECQSSCSPLFSPFCLSSVKDIGDRVGLSLRDYPSFYSVHMCSVMRNTSFSHFWYQYSREEMSRVDVSIWVV
ncbi:hypothetical protein M6B38_321620 [Iris pallida]|uniref:Uncharacterized protein n=1 Tax=Iris pallida TaxID=29817 RepID=A0AAX6DPB6_IRIPA|nr:hypothetical protein M6B38_234935 [Iris pallida]KAJ6820754.1 hypothetical protein M6B38_395830 [Iris pallida]KAJ6838094.1 hypothetical protein M6B38_321620 [Iris pallida]